MLSIHCISVFLFILLNNLSTAQCPILPYVCHSILLYSCCSIFPSNYSSNTPNYSSSVHAALCICVLPFFCCIVSLSLRSSAALSVLISSFWSNFCNVSPPIFSSVAPDLLPSALPQLRLNVLLSLFQSSLCLSMSRSLRFSVPPSYRPFVTSPFLPSFSIKNKLFAF